MRGLICLVWRHSWYDLQSTPRGIDFAEWNRRVRAARGFALIRECARCGRVECSAFTGRFSHAPHLERAR